MASNQENRQTDGKGAFLASFDLFERSLNGETSQPLHETRRRAIAEFEKIGLPSGRDEEWRFTTTAPLTGRTFRPSVAADYTSISDEDLKELSFDEPTGHRLVFVDGHFVERLSRIMPSAEGVRIGSLASIMKSDPAAVEATVASLPERTRSAFTALNTAFLRDGAYIEIPNGKIVEEPIHLLFIGTAGEEAVASHPRTIISVGRSAQATIIEEYTGFENARYFTNPVTQISVGENAVVDHYKLQHESPEAVHVGTQVSRQERNSTFTTFAVCFGNALLRNDSDVVLEGEGAHCTLDGLYLANGVEMVDNHTSIDHAQPHCKGILNDKGRGVFSGRIIVREGAQKTDSKQSNMNLVLSNEATIDTKPQLEIFADDVRCTHGATIGQLDETMIFYLRARGIGEPEARAMLTYAFATDVIERIKVESVCEYLDRLLGLRLEH